MGKRGRGERKGRIRVDGGEVGRGRGREKIGRGKGEGAREAGICEGCRGGW